MVASAGPRLRPVGVDDEVPGPGDVHTVGERLTGQVGVDQGGHGADPGQAQPATHVLGTVGHEQRHHVAPADALLAGPVAHPGRLLAELTVGDLASVVGGIDDRHPLGMTGDDLRELAGHAAVGAGPVAQRRRSQRGHAAQVAHVAGESLGESHTATVAGGE